MKKFNWLTDEARTFMKRDKGYLKNGQTAEERYRAICDSFERISGIEGFSDKFYGYCEKNWVSFASPVLANMGGYGSEYGLPASCNFGSVSDSLEDIFASLKEMALLAKHGAGTAKNFSKIRASGEPINSGGKSDGPCSWIELYEKAIRKTSQGSVRRGHLTPYLSVDHPDIEEFLTLCTEGSPVQKVTTGVTIPAGWMQSMLEGDAKKRNIYKTILKRRFEIGFPYVVFEDNMNKNCFKGHNDKEEWLYTSNICTEVSGVCNEHKEFVCVLSSANMVHYDEWKETSFIYDLRIALDCVVTEYLDKAQDLKGFDKAIRYLKAHRSVGLGVLGYHDYLQKNMIPFGSLQAQFKNEEIFKHISEQTHAASQWMAKEWGEPEYCKGYGVRSSENIAVAPTKSTSFLMNNRSLGIEPIKSNYTEKSLAKVLAEYKNPQLLQVLEEKGKNTVEVWDSINYHFGSVQHLDFLSDLEKDVFKTAFEISQMDIVKTAAQRQKYIDQGQSLNLFIHPDTPAKDISDLYVYAWENGIKTLYYQYNINSAQKYSKELMTCSSCEG